MQSNLNRPPPSRIKSRFLKEKWSIRHPSQQECVVILGSCRRGRSKGEIAGFASVHPLQWGFQNRRGDLPPGRADAAAGTANSRDAATYGLPPRTRRPLTRGAAAAKRAAPFRWGRPWTMSCRSPLRRRRRYSARYPRRTAPQCLLLILIGVEMSFMISPVSRM